MFVTPVQSRVYLVDKMIVPTSTRINSQLTTILCPVLIGDLTKEKGHWILFHINITDREMTVYDSLRKPILGKKDMQDMVENIKEMVCAMYAARGVENTFRTKRFCAVLAKTNPKQVNGVDCGAFVLAHATTLVYGGNHTDMKFLNVHVEYYRRIIALTILKKISVLP